MYFCAFGFLLLIPLGYLACQVLTWVVYEGRWRRLSLIPIGVVLLALVPLAIWPTTELFSILFLAAPGAGLLALSVVWAAYSHSADGAPGGATGGAPGGAPGGATGAAPGGDHADGRAQDGAATAPERD